MHICTAVLARDVKRAPRCGLLFSVYSHLLLVLIIQLQGRVEVVEALLHDVRQILSKHLRRLCSVDGRNSLASLRKLRKLARQGVIDDLFVETRRQHVGPPFVVQRKYITHFAMSQAALSVGHVSYQYFNYN